MRLHNCFKHIIIKNETFILYTLFVYIYICIIAKRTYKFVYTIFVFFFVAEKAFSIVQYFCLQHSALLL